MTPIVEKTRGWFKAFSARDPRRGSRKKKPPLVAYFWDGGQPVAHEVRNLGHAGFYLATSERWSLGTLIMMTLQRTSTEPGEPNCSVIIMSKVIRHGEDGVAFAFMPVDSAVTGSHSGPGSHPADKKTLDRFLHLVKVDSA
ncbi:MAG TPA: hypothetical protein VFW25_07480 [Silvibacterium sp.]|nr:hypothetical protein [Silvibacterium sp.]